MQDILNFIQINENIATSGQPTPKQFEKIAKKGYEVVINLALHNASNAIENQDKIVTKLQMSYFHIPVEFENPKLEQASLFLNTLKSLSSKKVWVHCAMNYRVTAFMYLYHKHVLQTPFEQIDLSMFEQWSPNEKWKNLIKSDYEDLSL